MWLECTVISGCETHLLKQNDIPIFICDGVTIKRTGSPCIPILVGPFIIRMDRLRIIYLIHCITQTTTRIMCHTYYYINACGFTYIVQVCECVNAVRVTYNQDFQWL